MLFEFIFSVVFATYSALLLAMVHSFGHVYPTQIFWGLTSLLYVMALSCSCLALLKDIVVLCGIVLLVAFGYRRTQPVPKPHEGDPYLQRGRGEDVAKHGRTILVAAVFPMALSYIVMPVLMWLFGKEY